MDGAAYLRAGGVVTGGAVAYTVAHSSYVPLSVPLFTIFVLGAVAVSELMSPRPSRSATATARLAARDSDTYLPPGARRHLFWLSLAVLVGLPVIAVLASGSPIGIVGRQDSVTNLWLLLPAVIALGAWGLLARHLLRVIAESGHAGLEPHQLASDEAWRRRAARLVYGTTGVLLAAPLAGGLLVLDQHIYFLTTGGWGWIMLGVTVAAMVVLIVLGHHLHVLTHPGPPGEVTPAAEHAPAEALA
ncbi:hypothetical protein [Catellatospora sichuanensis]|uniref:hypothetical protein n=1 Tax=Catellatospora sichuanensis TaxID=1969805 RepID=UPI001FEB070F|nr:hypothetical protein [Catellatospora sichuanensis]